ncbi:MAG: DNA alkylation repair protein [Candidatus Aenigmatarchaeota archaeon]
MNVDDVLEKLEELSDSEKKEEVEKFGINTDNSLGGISIPELRKLAKEIGKDHSLALKLWETGVSEAMKLAAMIDIPEKVTSEQMDSWVEDFDSWDLCDLVCQDLFIKTDFVGDKINKWTGSEEEFVKRVGFVLIAERAIHDKKANNEDFEKYFSIVKREVDDSRNFVKKAISWALREMGKRNKGLNERVIEVAREIKEDGSNIAKWISSDVIRELGSDKIQKKI